jgi:hypothetical protein
MKFTVFPMGQPNYYLFKGIYTIEYSVDACA